LAPRTGLEPVTF